VKSSRGDSDAKGKNTFCCDSDRDRREDGWNSADKSDETKPADQKAKCHKSTVSGTHIAVSPLAKQQNVSLSYFLVECILLDRIEGVMSDERLRFPDWQGPLRELILEVDPEKLCQNIVEVERLISERRQQLWKSGDGIIERNALDEAVNYWGPSSEMWPNLVENKSFHEGKRNGWTP
jgi:hypothetical protein